MKTIAIIGAGFCGTVVASRLLTTAHAEPLEILLVNASGLLARGLAFGTRSNEHVLNVPAGRMGASSDDEGEFLRYIRRRDPRFSASSFAPRRLFGDYLEALLSQAARHPSPGNRFRGLVGQVVALHRQGDGRWQLSLDRDDVLIADRVVLAFGNFEPADPPLSVASQAVLRSPRYLRDPWSTDRLDRLAPDAPILLLGSGLTMLDVMLSLRARGIRVPLVALSRRGLIPQAHRENDQPPSYRTLLPHHLLGQPSARRFCRLLRREVLAVQSSGVDWRDVVGSLRATTPRLWQALSEAEQRRFLRHLRAYWDVHRHRCAPQVADALGRELACGGLRVVAGRVEHLEEDTETLHVHWTPRGGSAGQILRACAVINCTGPSSDLLRLKDPLVGQLLKQRLIHADPLRIGLRVDPHYQTLGADGQATVGLHYIGPLLRAQFWESTAVPELRLHARQLCRALSGWLDGIEVPPLIVQGSKLSLPF